MSLAADELLDVLGPCRLVVFDCDGTLIDSQHNIIAAVEKVFHSIDLLPPERSLIRRQVGLPPDAAIAAMLPLADAAMHQRVAEAFRRLRPQLQAEKRPIEPLYPGISDLMNQLQHPELFLGIATGKGRPGLDMVLDQHALAGYFHTLQTGDRCRGKPDPEMLERALGETGLTAEAAVMVGDTSFDMAMALAAGVKAVGVSWGYHTAADLHAAGAHAVIGHPSELPAILRQLGHVPS